MELGPKPSVFWASNQGRNSAAIFLFANRNVNAQFLTFFLSHNRVFCVEWKKETFLIRQICLMYRVIYTIASKSYRVNGTIRGRDYANYWTQYFVWI